MNKIKTPEEFGNFEYGQLFLVKTPLGKDLAVYNLKSEEEKYPYQLGLANFDAHGASLKGPDTSGIYSEPYAVFQLITDKPGKLIATSYCNIHGFWKYENEVKVE